MRVVVGQNTIVKKITVGTPLRVGSAANGSLTGLDDVMAQLIFLTVQFYNMTVHLENSCMLVLHQLLAAGLLYKILAD